MFGKAGLSGLMKQAQQMQERMKKAQEELGNVEVVGEAGAGMVKITMTCHHGVRRVDISDEAVQEMVEDKNMLEDLVAAAFNDAVQKAAAATEERMGQFTQGLNLPAGMGDLFKSWKRMAKSPEEVLMEVADRLKRKKYFE